jgi:hypothetical protein
LARSRHYLGARRMSAFEGKTDVTLAASHVGM